MDVTFYKRGQRPDLTPRVLCATAGWQEAWDGEETGEKHSKPVTTHFSISSPDQTPLQGGAGAGRIQAAVDE